MALEVWGIYLGILIRGDPPANHCYLQVYDGGSSFESAYSHVVQCASLVWNFDQFGILYGSKVQMVLRATSGGYLVISSAAVYVCDKGGLSSIADIIALAPVGAKLALR
jgi:hypothetical protein